MGESPASAAAAAVVEGVIVVAHESKVKDCAGDVTL